MYDRLSCGQGYLLRCGIGVGSGSWFGVFLFLATQRTSISGIVADGIERVQTATKRGSTIGEQWIVDPARLSRRLTFELFVCPTVKKEGEDQLNPSGALHNKVLFTFAMTRTKKAPKLETKFHFKFYKNN